MSNRAAFFVVERTLVRYSPLHTATWFAANAHRVGERLLRLSSMSMALPLRLPSPWADPEKANQLGWASLRGMTQDRLLTLGEEYTSVFLEGALNPSGLQLMAQAQKDGLKIIWLSDNLDAVIEPLAKHYHVDDLLCNRLEMRNQRVTGKLRSPVIASCLSGQWAKQYAIDHQIDLEQSTAYGGSAHDSNLLSAIGKPCAINPDRAMRTMARTLNWPIVEGE